MTRRPVTAFGGVAPAWWATPAGFPVAALETTPGLVAHTLRHRFAAAAAAAASAIPQPASPKKPAAVAPSPPLPAQTAEALAAADEVLVLLPGNPGVVDFYADFIVALAAQRPRCAVVVLGFAGHLAALPTPAEVAVCAAAATTTLAGSPAPAVCRAAAPAAAPGGGEVPSCGAASSVSGAAAGPWGAWVSRPDVVFTLDDQLAMASDFLAALRGVLTSTADGRAAPRVVLAGHSIGGYVCVRLLDRHQWLSRALLLAPTVCRLEASPNGQGMKPLVRSRAARWAAVRLASLGARLLPPAAVTAIVCRAEPQLTGAQHSAVLRMVAAPGMLANGLHMGDTEFRDVAAPDAPLLAATAARCSYYFAQGDGWVPPETAAAVTELVLPAGGRVAWAPPEERVSHAWCCGKSDVVAAFAAAELRETAGLDALRLARRGGGR